MKSVSKYLLCLAVCLFVHYEGLQAQTFFESVQGQTSVVLPAGGMARINTTASSLKIGYYYNRSDQNIVIGVDASGMSNNGFAPLITSRELSPEANININLGVKNISTGDSHLRGFDYLNLRVGIGAAQYYLIDDTAPFEQQVNTELFNKFNIGIAYNYYLSGNMIFGGYAGYDRTNNISSLTMLTVKETTTTTGMGSDGTVRTAALEYTAWEGEFRPLDQFSLFLDYVYIPDFLSNRVALSVYSRSQFNSMHHMTNGGIGIYLNREGEPLKIVGGLIYEFEDIFATGLPSASPDGMGTLGVVLGYHF